MENVSKIEQCKFLSAKTKRSRVTFSKVKPSLIPILKRLTVCFFVERQILQTKAITLADFDNNMAIILDKNLYDDGIKSFDKYAIEKI